MATATPDGARKKTILSVIFKHIAFILVLPRCGQIDGLRGKIVSRCGAKVIARRQSFCKRVMGENMVRVGIVGGTGYTGVELLRLLAAHEDAEVVAITSRAENGRRVDELFPNLRGHYELAFSEPDVQALTRQYRKP